MNYRSNGKPSFALLLLFSITLAGGSSAARADEPGPTPAPSASPSTSPSAVPSPAPSTLPQVTAPFDLQVYRNAYQYAYTSDGLNMSSSQARAFAERMAIHPAGNSALAGYRDAYRYAYSSEGQNLSRTGSRAFADRILEQPRPLIALRTFQDAYAYGYSSEGHNMSRNSSITFAWRFASRPDGRDVLRRYRELYQYAYTSEGLNLSRNGAKAWAENHSGLNQPPGSCFLDADTTELARIFQGARDVLGQTNATQVYQLYNHYCMHPEIDRNDAGRALARVISDVLTKPATPTGQLPSTTVTGPGGPAGAGY